MRRTVKDLDRKQEETAKRVAAIEADLREFRRLVPYYYQIHPDKVGERKDEADDTRA